eukprot:c7493_g1_i2.p1 GENE.c7493_g1_i2~~c7493_g1_i2.p1  ORF type:complete len:468 (-),score=113.74 c7493_g1_i2:543-1946(-)
MATQTTPATASQPRTNIIPLYSYDINLAAKSSAEANSAVGITFKPVTVQGNENHDHHNEVVSHSGGMWKQIYAVSFPSIGNANQIEISPASSDQTVSSLLTSRGGVLVVEVGPAVSTQSNLASASASLTSTCDSRARAGHTHTDLSLASFPTILCRSRPFHFPKELEDKHIGVWGGWESLAVAQCSKTEHSDSKILVVCVATKVLHKFIPPRADRFREISVTIIATSTTGASEFDNHVLLLSRRLIQGIQSGNGVPVSKYSLASQALSIGAPADFLEFLIAHNALDSHVMSFARDLTDWTRTALMAAHPLANSAMVSGLNVNKPFELIEQLQSGPAFAASQRAGIDWRQWRNHVANFTLFVLSGTFQEDVNIREIALVALKAATPAKIRQVLNQLLGFVLHVCIEGDANLYLRFESLQDKNYLLWFLCVTGDSNAVIAVHSECCCVEDSSRITIFRIGTFKLKAAVI